MAINTIHEHAGLGFGEQIHPESSLPEVSGGPNVHFDTNDVAGTFLATLNQLGMVRDPVLTAETLANAFRVLHNEVSADGKAFEDGIEPFYAIDCPSNRSADEMLSVFGGILSTNGDQAEVIVFNELQDKLSPHAISSRVHYSRSVPIGAVAARGMLLGGSKENNPGLYYAGLNARHQLTQTDVRTRHHEQNHPETRIANMSLIDILVVNAARAVRGERPLDNGTVCRIPQAGNPSTGLIDLSGRAPGVLAVSTNRAGSTEIGLITSGNKSNIGVRLSIGKNV